MSRKNQQAEVELRRKKVAANLVGGLNYREMAETFGVSISTISKDVGIILGRWQREQVGSTGEWVQVELRRLDKALNAIWNKVLEGDPLAIDRMLKIMERRARLLGLDTPEQNRNLNIDLEQLTDEQLQRIARGEDPITVVLSSRGGTGTP